MVSVRRRTHRQKVTMTSSSSQEKTCGYLLFSGSVPTFPNVEFPESRSGLQCIYQSVLALHPGLADRARTGSSLLLTMPWSWKLT